MIPRNASAAATPVLLGAAATLSLLLYVRLSRLGDLRERLPGFLVLFAALFIVYAASLVLWWRVRDVRLVAAGIAVALLFRGVLVPVPPSLSDDLYRYLWDGRLMRHGTNPMLHAPDDPALADLRDALWEKTAHRDVAGVYPPVALAVFALFGRDPVTLKAALALLDVGAAVVLGLLLRSAGLPEGRAMVYAWSPLAVVEIGGSGHLEPVALLPALCAALLLLEGRRGPAGLWTALAASGRLLHASWAVAWWRRLGRRGWLLFAAGGLLLWALLLAGGPPAGLLEYGRRWEFNASLFSAVLAAIRALDPTEALKGGITWLRQVLGDLPGLHALYFWTDAPTLARISVLAAFLGWAGRLGLRRTPPLRAAYLVTGAFLLLSPTVHPWYVLHVVPFLAFFPSLAWLVFTATVALSYVAAMPDQGWKLPFWVLAAEYVPLAALFWLGPRVRRWMR